MTHPIVDLIDAHWAETSNEPPRPHLGASGIGAECHRQLWYGFRWASEVRFTGRLLRLFNRGHSEEPRIVSDLTSIGLVVHERDPETGKQWNFNEHGRHYGGSSDGMATNVPGLPRDLPVVLEFKTSALKPFSAMQKDGVEKAQPKHYAQMQQYMAWHGFTKALYVMVCKNDDHLHVELIDFDPEFAQATSDKARQIIEAIRPPARISDSPAFFSCKWCDHYGTCHDLKPAVMSCRTCISATPRTDAVGGWHCDHHDLAIPLGVQRSGCPDHRFIPDLVPFGVAPRANGRDITYDLIGTDQTFTNGAPGPGCYDSKELQGLTLHTVNDPGVETLRETFNGRVTTTQGKDAWIDDIPF